MEAGAFEEEDIIHGEGTVDPVRDMEIIHGDRRLKDEEMMGPIIDKLEKTAIRGGDKKLKPEYDVICKIKSWVMDEKKHVRSMAIGTARRGSKVPPHSGDTPDSNLTWLHLYLRCPQRQHRQVWIVSACLSLSQIEVLNKCFDIQTDDFTSLTSLRKDYVGRKNKRYIECVCWALRSACVSPPR
ncbi:obg-like ATPase 1 isoform 4-T7 [Spinachia spinachia]